MKNEERDFLKSQLEEKLERLSRRIRVIEQDLEDFLLERDLIRREISNVQRELKELEGK